MTAAMALTERTMLTCRLAEEELHCFGSLPAPPPSYSSSDLWNSTENKKRADNAAYKSKLLRPQNSDGWLREKEKDLAGTKLRH